MFRTFDSLTRYSTGQRKARHPNTDPAYYPGHHACLWITVMRPGCGE